MIKENKTSKYLLYAIGEIALVMIGILLALQVNNWNEARKSRALELNILKDLHRTLNTNFDLVNRGISGNESAIRSCELILGHLNENRPYNDSLNYHFENSHIWWKTTLTNSAYQRAKEHGMNFIKDDGLRNNLNSLYNLLLGFGEKLNEREELYYYHTASPILTQIFESTEIPLDNTHIKGNFAPLDYEKLKSNEAYKTLLRTSIGNKKKMNTWIKNILRVMKEVDEGLMQVIDTY